MDEPLDFAVTYETLFRNAFASDVTPRMKERLRALGLDLDKPLLPGYPAKLWPQVMRVTAEELHPTRPFNVAAEQIARRFTHSYFDTMIGKAAALMLRAIGPMRALGRIERTLHTTNNYQRTRLTALSPTQAELWIAEVNGVTGWFVGMIEATCEHIGVRAGKVELVSEEGASATFRLSWSA